MRPRFRFLLIAGLCVGAALGVVSPGTAHVATGSVDPHWTCRASVAYANLVTGDPADPTVHFEPGVANGDQFTGGDRDECATDAALFPSGDNNPLQFGDAESGMAVVQPTFARTDSNSDPKGFDRDFAYKQKPSADTQVARVLLQQGENSLEIVGIESHAAADSAGCQNRVPVLNDPTKTWSKVVSVKVNGQERFPVPPEITLANPNDPKMGIFVRFNTQTQRDVPGGRQVIQRAVHAIIARDATNYIEVVAGETRIDYHGDVCTPPSQRCPEGSAFDDTRGVCIVTVTVQQQAPCPAGSTRDTATGACIVVVGRPSTDPGSGGNVVPLQQVAGVRTAHPCRNPRFGRQVAIVGTNRGDRITGSNRSDRIFVFAGNDRVSGGRGNDCIEGGLGSDQLDGSNGNDWLLGSAGNDQLSGGQRNDTLYGGAGNDKVLGGSGNDRLFAGKGRNKVDGGKGNDVMVGGPNRDYITGGNGRDVVRGGGGNDSINVATAGPATKVDCGRGVDTVRINNNEVRRIKNCERVFVTTRLSRLRSLGG